MNRLLLALVALVTPVATASDLAAQELQGSPTLHTRVAGTKIHAAIEIRLEKSWHLYHRELGHEKAVGKPTKVTLGGTGITWGEVLFPDPVKIDQSEIGSGVFILGHEGTIVLRAQGELAEGASGADASAKIDGLVCADSCVPYRRTVTTSGTGPDALFPGVPSAGGTSPPASGGETTNATPGTPVDPAAQASPSDARSRPTADERQGGRSDATLFTRLDGTKARAALLITIAEGFHLYATEKGNPKGIGTVTRVALMGEGIRWSAPSFPEPKRIDQSDVEEGAWILGYDGALVVTWEGELESGAAADAIDQVWGTIKGQNCDESSCIEYAETFVTRGRGEDPLYAGVAPGASSGDTGTAADSEDGEEEFGGDVLGEGLLGFLLAAIGWGLFALLMPCTYPMIPITISFFTKQADKRGESVLPLALAYGAGIVLIFVVIGVAFGSFIIPFANHWITNLVIGVAFVYFSLTLFGLISMQPPRFLMNVAGQASSQGGYLGVFLMGATLVVTSFTCTGPFVGSLLGSSGNRTLPEVALGMGVFGLTMALPFVLLSLVPGKIKAMPKSGEWMNTLKFSLGFIELAAALKFLSNVDVDRKWNLISRELFLVTWGVLGLLLALYLLGIARLFGREARVGLQRIGFGLAAAVFALFCFWGLPGRPMGELMSAFLPPYSGGRVFPQWYVVATNWPIIENDYEKALALAGEQGKLLLVNFTGEL